MSTIYRKLRVAIINSTLSKPYWSYGDHWVDGFKDAGCDVKVFRYEQIPHLPPHYDLYFFVELRFQPDAIPWYIFPRALYSWDAHVSGAGFYEPLHRHFDKIFLASKIDTEELQKIHPKKFSWLPEACNPRVHSNLNKDRPNYLGYIGNPDARFKRNGKYKNNFLNYLKEKRGLFYDKDIYGQQYTNAINSIKVMFDRTIAHNVGTRIFESGCAGCCTLWSKAQKNTGIDELLIENVHYITYDDTIEGLERVLDSLDDAKIKKVACAAEKYVLQHHTYAHRVRQLIKDIGINEVFISSEI